MLRRQRLEPLEQIGDFRFVFLRLVITRRHEDLASHDLLDALADLFDTGRL
ncbi:hypothetical protein D9M68_358400 [compost metagenome]